MSWIDSHCHLDALEEGAEEAVRKAKRAGVDTIITVGVDVQSSRTAVQIAERIDGVRAVVGLHPHDARLLDDSMLIELREIASSPHVVAIGEIGLDFFRDHSPRDSQRAAFEEQLGLARELDKPVVLHVRDAYADVCSILRDWGRADEVVFHCFSAGPAEAREALDLGAHLSFAGNISFKSATSVRDAAAIAPLDRVLVETDSPYLAPVPHRGRPNSPSLLPLVGEALAAALSKPTTRVQEVTSSNARAFFRL